ncbi:uncharacterized protein V6R79_008588 [Siganus canaliculatus]
MMAQQNLDKDVEAQKMSGPRRGRCLDAFLVTSVILLFVAVTAVAVGEAMVMMELRSKREALPEYQTAELRGDSPSPTYKMENFVYLEATSSKLTTATMKLAEKEYGTGSTVGSNFEFDKMKNSLKPRKEGTYFIYLNLNLTCGFQCKPGVLHVAVGDKLTCKVDLPETAPVSKRCWTVTQLQPGEELLTQITVPQEGLENWRLELNSSGVGMYLVD